MLYLILLYLVVNAARFVMVFFFYPIVSRTGYGLDLKSAVMLAAGGIHGAVGLALAMVIFEEYKGSTDAARVMFHIGGVTVLSLLLNGILSDPLLKNLGLAELDPARMAIKEDVMQQLRSHNTLLFDEICGEMTIDASEKAEVLKLCTILEDHHGHGHGAPEFPLLKAHASDRPSDRQKAESAVKSHTHQGLGEGSVMGASLAKLKAAAEAPVMEASFSEGTKKSAVVAARELFLRALKNQYEEQGKRGVLAAGSPGDFCLRSSVDHAMEEVDEGLTDVAHVFKQITKQSWYGAFFSLSITEWSRCCLLHSLIDAHSEARATLEEALGSMKIFEEAKEAVIKESNAQVALAQQALDEMNSHLVKAIGPRQIACKVLAGSEEHIEKMVAAGMLREADAHHLLEETELDIIGAQAAPR